MRWGILGSGERRCMMWLCTLSFFIAVKIGGIESVVVYQILSLLQRH